MKKLMVIFLLIIFIAFISAKNLTYDTQKNILNLTYDKNNRVLTKIGTGISINYTYDFIYNDTITNVTNGNVTINYQYDDKKRAVKESVRIDGIVFDKFTSYDSIDRVKNVRTNNNISFEYNTLGKLGTISNTISNFTYNENFQIIKKYYLNNLVSTFNYNNLFRVTNIKTNNSQNKIYDYDSSGNIILIHDEINNKIFTITYDNLNRINKIIINKGVIPINYNSIGNIVNLSFDGTERVYTYSSLTHAPSAINITSKEIFSYKNSSGVAVASFYSDGNLTLKGVCNFSANCLAPQNSLIFLNSSNSTVAYIDSHGNLCIESGSCNNSQSFCNPSEDALIVQSEIYGTNWSYIDFDGNLCLTGKLKENS
jgi:hypothetical protein